MTTAGHFEQILSAPDQRGQARQVPELGWLHLPPSGCLEMPHGVALSITPLRLPGRDRKPASARRYLERLQDALPEARPNLVDDVSQSPFGGPNLVLATSGEGPLHFLQQRPIRDAASPHCG